VILVDLVSGFLGAGKTTWLERLAQRDPGRYDCVIVNEAATTGIDDSTLERVFPGRVLLLSGACICCGGAEALRTTLREKVAAHHRRSADGDGYVAIETSGITDPEAVLSLITSDPVLSANIRIRDVMVLVSAVGAHHDLRHRAVAQRQVAVADVVYVSRSDLVDVAACESVVAAVRALNDDVVVRDARTDQLLTTTAQVTIPRLARTQDSSLRTWSTPVGPGTSWAEYAVWLHLMTQSHPDGLLRTKAVLPAASGAMLVQSVGGSVLPVVAAQPTAHYRAAGVLVDLDVSRVERSFSAFVPSAQVDPRRSLFAPGC
jgi:G3E family GTPase